MSSVVIKDAVAPVPLYTMQNLKLPLTICDTIDELSYGVHIETKTSSACSLEEHVQAQKYRYGIQNNAWLESNYKWWVDMGWDF